MILTKGEDMVRIESVRAFFKDRPKESKDLMKGFTLVEILIVIAILAILIGIAIPRFRGMQEQAILTQAQAETRTLKTAIESARVNKGSYPVGDDTPAATYYANTTWLTTAPVTPRLIDQALDDPYTAATDEYYYRRGTTAAGQNYYAVCSRGSDGAIDVTNAELNDGILTSAERDDDVCATNTAPS
jgi:general secretion pathway protein G